MSERGWNLVFLVVLACVDVAFLGGGIGLCMLGGWALAGGIPFVGSGLVLLCALVVAIRAELRGER